MVVKMGKGDRGSSECASASYLGSGGSPRLSHTTASHQNHSVWSRPHKPAIKKEHSQALLLLVLTYSAPEVLLLHVLNFVKIGAFD